jgi:hypothetical protein
LCISCRNSPKSTSPFPSPSTSETISCSSSCVGFWPRERSTVPAARRTSPRVRRPANTHTVRECTQPTQRERRERARVWAWGGGAVAAGRRLCRASFEEGGGGAPMSAAVRKPAGLCRTHQVSTLSCCYRCPAGRRPQAAVPCARGPAHGSNRTSYRRRPCQRA